MVGIHKGVRVLGNNSLGLSLNTFENPQEIIFQLAEELQVQNKMKSYKKSCKAMREEMEEDSANDQLISSLKHKNMKLEK